MSDSKVPDYVPTRLIAELIATELERIADALERRERNDDD